MTAVQQLAPLVKFKIEVLKGAHAGQVFSLHHKSAFIGRDADNEIALSNDPRISRKHAEIKQVNGQFYVINLSQKNYILVDGDSVDNELIGQNAIIQVGESELRFSADFPTTSAPAEETRPKLMHSVQKMGTLSPIEQSPKPLTYGSPTPLTFPQAKSFPQAKAFPQAKSFPQGQAIPRAKSKLDPRVKFYGIIAIIGGVLFLVFSGGGSKDKKKAPPFRGSPEIHEEIATSQKSMQALDARIAKLNDATYRRAQENYIKGFREFRQGHYTRAKDYFQIVLSLDPSHEMASRYYRLSLVKFDELIQANINQGLRYRERRNYKFCQSSFQNVLIMIQNNKTHPRYIEVSQFLDECTKAIEGRY